MMPKNIYFIQSNSKLFAHQGRDKACVLGYLRYNDACLVAQFIEKRNIQVKKCRSKEPHHMYKVLRSKKTSKNNDNLEILQTNYDDFMVDFLSNKTHYEIIDEVIPHTQYIIELHSNFVYDTIDFETDIDTEIYREKLECLYTGTKFDLIDTLEKKGYVEEEDDDDYL